jgi:hypothetical protein
VAENITVVSKPPMTAIFHKISFNLHLHLLMMQLKRIYLAFTFVILLLACKKEKTPPTREEILTGATWSLHSQHLKLSNESTKEIISNTETTGNCSMNSRLQFLNNNVFRYTENCSFFCERRRDLGNKG